MEHKDALRARLARNRREQDDRGRVEDLPFVLVRACDECDFADVSSLRRNAYENHLPGEGHHFSAIDDGDREPSTVVFLCREKSTGRALGTLRVQNEAAGRLPIEAGVELPAELIQSTRVELCRLAVAPGADRRVRLALMKASYLHCLSQGIRWIVIGARSDALIRIYRGLGFREVFGEGVRIALAHAGGLPHGILAFDVFAADAEWRRIRHPLYEFMAEVFHPDIEGSSPPVGGRMARKSVVSDRSAGASHPHPVF